MRASPTDDRRERLEALWRAHADAVLGYALRRADGDAARDVVAETFAVAWRRLDDVPGDPLPWLLGVARKALANRRRGDRRRGALTARLAALPPEHGADPAERAGEAQAVRAALGRLPSADREALILVAWDGLTPAQAAAVAGCSPRAFSKRLSRARARLAAALVDVGAAAPHSSEAWEEPA
ncbi:MAG TPA: sigma-70 family RNA polymerase sigma factor [Miltoncostaea sp.]|nr:sigma-70 family RNA polymerase sigma factor [Miltoncostaea sp.]